MNNVETELWDPPAPYYRSAGMIMRKHDGRPLMVCQEFELIDVFTNSRDWKVSINFIDAKCRESSATISLGRLAGERSSALQAISGEGFRLNTRGEAVEYFCELVFICAMQPPDLRQALEVAHG